MPDHSRKAFDIPSHPGNLPDDIEVCIGGIDSIASENVSAVEISLSREMIITIGCWLGNEEQTKTLYLQQDFPMGLLVISYLSNWFDMVCIC